MKPTIEQKQAHEKNIIQEMIFLYCRKNHHSANLCESCKEVLEYSLQRIDHCPFMKEKTFCSCCKVHCYRSDMREKIRTIMRFSGPRMLLSHPILTLKHIWFHLKTEKAGKDSKK